MPKNGMRKNHAASVQTILPMVHRLEIFPTASPLLSSSVILIFVTIGATIHRRKLVGLNRIVTRISELILSESQRETIHISTGVFTRKRIMILRHVYMSIRERSFMPAPLSAYFPQT